MDVSSQQSQLARIPAKGPRARTWRLMVDAASRMMREGTVPSVSEVAEFADVSRSTAYRYFPTQSAMVQAVVAVTLGPILKWQSDSRDVGQRVHSLFETSLSRIIENEATFRAALRQSLEMHDGITAEEHRKNGRGHRVELINRALAGANLSKRAKSRLAQALSIAFGIESIVVLRDIWNLSDAEIESVSLWAAGAMIQAALHEDEGMELQN